MALMKHNSEKINTIQENLTRFNIDTMNTLPIVSTLHDNAVKQLDDLLFNNYNVLQIKHLTALSTFRNTDDLIAALRLTEETINAIQPANKVMIDLATNTISTLQNPHFLNHLKNTGHRGLLNKTGIFKYIDSNVPFDPTTYFNNNNTHPYSNNSQPRFFQSEPKITGAEQELQDRKKLTFRERAAQLNIDDDLMKKFECAISLEIMNDPVTIDGTTYDRGSLDEYHKNGPHYTHPTEPNKILPANSLLTDEKIKQHIDKMLTTLERQQLGKAHQIKG